MRQRIIVLVLFVAFALLEISDAFGIAQIVASPEASAAMLNLSVAGQQVRALILLVLSSTIAIGAIVTVIGAWQRNRLVYAWVVVAVGYVVYGLYQIGSALVQSHMPSVAATGVVYLVLGAAAYSFGRPAGQALKRPG